MPTKSVTSLPRYVVGIDVETTSLDPAGGEIIDVAAIRYELASGKEIDRFTSLTRPSRPLSAEITALTGIRQEMVAAAPTFAEVRNDIRKFIGADTVFAHNAPFDVGFLAHHGLVLANPVWDTFLLSTIAWPAMASYNLGFLAQELGVVVTEEHRAAADVTLAWQILGQARRKLAVTPTLYHTIEEILRKGDVAHYIPLFSSKEAVTAESAAVKPRRVVQEEAASSALKLEDIFAAGGPLQRMPGYTLRKEQVQMAHTVFDWIRDNRIGLIEAETGVGKTFAYLAAVLAALSTHAPVVISTYTKQLQDQLVQHDIPHLLEALGLSRRVAVLKGRRNYLCTTRLTQILKRPTFSSEESFFLTKLLYWLESGGSGDLEQINLSHQARTLVRTLHADTPQCRAMCGRQKETRCTYQLARRHAAQAELLVVNHALLARMSVGEEAAIPAAVVIVDEGHHLEAAARQASRVDLTADRLAEITDALRTCISASSDPQALSRAETLTGTLVSGYAQWLQEARVWLQRHTPSDRILLTSEVRKGTAWQGLRTQGEVWCGQLKFMIGLVRGLQHAMPAQQRPACDEALREAERLVFEFQRFFEGSADRIQWLAVWQKNLSEEARVELHDVTVSVANMLNALFSSVKATILTSATLSVNGNFDYIKKMLGLENTATARLGTVYDLRAQMLLYLVDDGPQPGSPQFEPFLAKVIVNIALLLQGRTLILFTAKAAIQSMYQKLIQQLNKAQIRLFAQNVTGGRRNMLERFKSVPESVLLGTATFWEGIDVPGESLSCVIIPRLPFAAPDDPVVQALARALNVNSFQDIALPRMLITLRQGIGRLIRSDSDHGVVVLLDPRLHRAEYGQRVIQNLPPATIHIGGAHDIVATLRQWFGDATIKKWEAASASTSELS